MWEQENRKMIRSMALAEIPEQIRSMEIPEQMLIEILIRLPVKSLMKFKSVSKFWLALISSRYFTNRFLKNRTSHQRIFAYLANEQNLNNYAWFTSSLSSDASVSYFNQDLTMPRMEGEFLNAVRGLACFGTNTRLKICNVYTRQVVELPPISDKNGWSCLTYNNVRDEYKMIRLAWEYNRDAKVVEHENQVLVLGPGASWRDIQCHIPHRASRYASQGICINGVLYYEARTYDGSKWVLMSFDLTSEEFNVIELPDIMDTSLTTLMNYNGEIAFLDYFDVMKDGVINLWVVDGDDKSRLSKKMTFVLPRIGFLVGGPSICYRTPHHTVPILNLFRLSDVRMGGTGRNGELWLRKARPHENQPRQVLIYDLERNQITHRIDTRPLGSDVWSGSSQRTNWLLGTFWDDIENIMHLEI